MVEVTGFVEVELVTFGARATGHGVPLCVHEIEVRDREAIVAVAPDRQQRPGSRSLGSQSGRRELDLFIDHALNGDLPGGAAAARWGDDEPLGTDRNEAVAGRLRARPGQGLALALECLERFFPELMELSLGEAHRIAIDQAQEVLSLVGFGGFFGKLNETDAAACQISRQAISLVGRRGKGVAFFFVEPRILG